jgi:hypothetical protein
MGIQGFCGGVSFTIRPTARTNNTGLATNQPLNLNATKALRTKTKEQTRRVHLFHPVPEAHVALADVDRISHVGCWRMAIKREEGVRAPLSVASTFEVVRLASVRHTDSRSEAARNF